MENSTLIKKINYECPFCDEIHSIEIRSRISKALIKNMEVEYEKIYYYCNVEDEEFVPAQIMDENLLKARDAYRTQKGLLTSNEIKEIRKNYNLNQVDFSNLLGWGDVTIQRYEKKLIQDETYDQVMRLVGEDPFFALEQLDKHKNSFKDDKYLQIRDLFKRQIREKNILRLNLQSIKNYYIQFEEKSDFNGYKKIDIDKTTNILAYFATYIPSLYKVKLMKLLWYVDALHFKEFQQSMTGLVYSHLPLGAVPIAHEELLRLPSIKVVEEGPTDFDVWYRIYPNKKIDLSLFSLDELRILNTVSTFFKDSTGKQISNYMHQEKAYLETTDNEIIPYSLAKEIREFR